MDVVEIVMLAAVPQTAGAVTERFDISQKPSLQSNELLCTQLTYCILAHRSVSLNRYSALRQPAGVGQSRCFVFFADGQAPLIRRHGAGPPMTQQI